MYIPGNVSFQNLTKIQSFAKVHNAATNTNVILRNCNIPTSQATTKPKQLTPSYSRNKCCVRKQRTPHLRRNQQKIQQWVIQKGDMIAKLTVR